jgi:hypothetical protein
LAASCPIIIIIIAVVDLKLTMMDRKGAVDAVASYHSTTIIFVEGSSRHGTGCIILIFATGSSSGGIAA